MIEIDKIYNTDCMEGFKLIDSKSVDMILTDIPYEINIGKECGLRKLDKGTADNKTFDLIEFLAECVRVLKGSIYVCCHINQVGIIYDFFRSMLVLPRLMIWEKNNPSPINGQMFWLTGIECIVCAKSTGATFNSFCRNTVLRYNSGRSNFHPTEKPLPLFEELIRVSSNEGDLILDPCIGSGTTAIAARRLNRKFLGFEIDAEYYKACMTRISMLPASIRELIK